MIGASQKLACYIDVVGESYGDQLTALRTSSYNRHYGEDVDISALRWNPWDLRFFSLGVFENHQLVSTLRLAHIKTERDYQQMMLSKFNSDAVSLPVVILSRAATHENYESRGLHTLLRYHAFGLALASGANWVAGTFKMDAKRARQLESMGYTLEVNPVPWDDFLKSHEPTYTATINLSVHFDNARSRMLNTIAPLLETYPVLYSQDVLVKRMLKS